MEIFGVAFLPVTGYEHFHLMVDQRNGNFTSRTRELTFERFAHMSTHGKRFLLSIRGLSRSSEAPMRLYPDMVAIHPRREGNLLTFLSLRSENSLLKIKVRCHVVTGKRSERSLTASLLVATRPNLRGHRVQPRSWTPETSPREYMRSWRFSKNFPPGVENLL